ncbi:MAG: polyprenyl synthetase family protein [Limisphaerales bacterium]
MFAAETKPAVGSATPAPALEVRLTWREIVESVEPFLETVARRLTEQVQTFDPEIALYARYALTRQGKQLRPALVALSGGAAGQVNDDLATVAVIIEMVHLATLVHDDVLDEAELRRGRPTLAVNWGNEISVLMGDCLFAHALRLAAGFPTTEICRAVASATKTVCSGEIRQTRWRRNFQFTRVDYFKVLEMKTAELFALSCDLGAWLSEATLTERSALRNYGLALGTAYQLYDDCLDLFGSEASVGKSLGTDLAKGKLTLPVLVVLESGCRADRSRLQELILQWKPSSFSEVLELLEKYDCLNESRAVIDQYISHARQTLTGLAPSESRTALFGLADFLAQQTEALGFTA